MKLFLLLVLSSGAFAQESNKYYRETSRVVGYSCPSGYYYNQDRRLCYPTPNQEDATSTNEGTIDAANSTSRHYRTDKEVHVTINNYANGKSKVDLPAMNIEGDLGVKRRRALDKKGILSAVNKALDGNWYEDEKDPHDSEAASVNDGELVLE